MQKDKVVLPESMLEELKALQRLSSKTNRATPLDHEYRRAGDMLADLAVETIAEYGVTVTGLSRQMGLSESAMNFFLQRRGAIPITPSVDRTMGPYKNVHGNGRTKGTTCSRGHDTSYPEARDLNGKGNCKQCRRDRQRDEYAKAKAA